MTVRIPRVMALWCAVLVATPGAAEEVSGTGVETQAPAVEEVIVTAQRTAESIQDVPIAVTALTDDVIEERQIINPSDLQLNVPNVSFGATNFGGSNFSIRGIGQLVVSRSGETGVSSQVNEIAVATNTLRQRLDPKGNVAFDDAHVVKRGQIRDAQGGHLSGGCA